MRLADQMLLAQIREALLGHIPDQQWALVEQEVEKAGGVDKVGGYTGVLLRDAIEKAKKNKVETVMSEFKAGKLKSSSGKKVKSRKQAIAIALSEQRRVKKEMLEKASFGGDRSAAGRYAAEQRWKGHAKTDKPSGEQKNAKESRAFKLGKENFLEAMRLNPKERSAHEKNPEKDKKSFQRSIRHAERTIKLLTERHPDTLYDMLGTFRPTQKTVDAAIKEQQRQIEIARGSLAGIEEFEARSSVSDDKQTVQSDKGQAPATEDDKLIVRRPDLLPEEAFRDKTQFKNFRQTETYNKIVQNKKAEIVRGKDGAASHRGSNLTAARDNLAMEEEMLRSFESGERSARQILGSPFKKTEARAILQARVADANATVQALEEFEDETSPGFLAS